MIKYRKITDIVLVIDTISIYRKKPISNVPIRYRYRHIDIGDISTIFSIYQPTTILKRDVNDQKRWTAHARTAPIKFVGLLREGSICQ